MKFQHVTIVGKYGAQHLSDTIARVIKVLEEEALPYSLDRETMPESFRRVPQALPLAFWTQHADLCIVIGGDGTFLYAGRAVAGRSCALIGINAGRLGFLADVACQDLEQSLRAMLHGAYECEERRLLAVTVQRQQKNIAQFQALNDAVIHKRNMARMIELDVFCRHHALSHYRADGLIISTPTGSTAYALAAGGPIIEPSLPVTLIVPICPQTLNQRPLIVDDGAGIMVRVHANNQRHVQITIDGQSDFLLQAGDEVHIQRGDALQVLHPCGYQFQERLRTKLAWGVTPEEGHGC